MNQLEIKIYYEDTDCGGVVYYANYLRYMEVGRTEYLAGKGVSVKELMDQGTIFVVSEAHIHYRSSAKYGDTVLVRTRVKEATRTSLLFEHTMTDKASGRLVAEAQARLVCVDTSGRPKRMPQEMADKLISPSP